MKRCGIVFQRAVYRCCLLKALELGFMDHGPINIDEHLFSISYWSIHATEARGCEAFGFGEVCSVCFTLNIYGLAWLP